MIYLY